MSSTGFKYGIAAMNVKQHLPKLKKHKEDLPNTQSKLPRVVLTVGVLLARPVMFDFCYYEGWV